MNPETADDLRRRDEQARIEAQSGFGRPLVLEAGAGTGKTATLVARMLAWSLGEGWERARSDASVDGSDPRSIAVRVWSGLTAITFTEAAAAEMAGRVEQALSRAQRGEAVDGFEPERLGIDADARAARSEALLDTIENLGVQTIHAWCRGILARFPLEARLHPRFEVDAAGEHRERIVRDVVESALGRALAASEKADLIELAARGVGPTRVESALVAWVAAGLQADDLEDPFTPERIAAWWQALGAATDGLAAACVDALEGTTRRVKNTIAVRQAVVQTVDLFGDTDEPRDLGALLALQTTLREVWVDGARKQLGNWTGGRFNGEEEERLGASSSRVSELAARVEPLLLALLDGDLELLRLAQRTLAPLLGEVRELLARRGALGYQDLLREARDLFRGRPDVCARVRRGIDGLLVDEFQDTDRLQCDVVSALTLEGRAEDRPWLFVVGDPKQSIYGWRSADLEAYEWFRSRVEQRGGSCLPLAVNYRSDPPILDEVERVIAPVMTRVRGLQPAFEPLLPCEARRNGSGFERDNQAAVEHWVVWSRPEPGGSLDPDTKAREAAETEARALASDLRRLGDASDAEFRWSKTAVLMRALSDVEVYLRALREAGVPYVVGRDRDYYQRREIIDAASLVRCVLDPHDHLALLSYIRSPSVGVPDAALLPLWSRGFPTAVSELPGAEAAGLDALAGLVARAAEEIPEEASEVAAVGSWEASLLGALETLAVLRGSLDDLATDRFVERLRHLWLGEVGESARFLGAFRAANLERFFRELADRLAEGADPESVLRRLREEVAGAHEVENATASGLERDAVQVMSIHGAKGLTFDHVYLVQLHKSPGGGARPELEWSRHDERCEYSLFGQSTLGQATARDRAADVARAEQVRTLYVAMTRPRVRLVLSGCWKESPDPVDPGSAPHLLSLLASRADGVADLPAMAERVVRRADPEIDGEQAVGVRWRFPAVFADPPAPAGRPGTSDLGPRATRSIERFAVERPSALARQRRPFSGRATGGSDSPDPDSSRESRAPSESDGAGTVESPRRDRAMAVGTAIHALLEEWDTGAEPGSELERRRSRLGSQLGGLVPPGELAAAVEEAEELLQAFADRGALARLHAIGDGIVARELPILRPPGSDGGAVLFESGIIDLVYRDPSTSELVIADYKTDRVSDRAECEAKAKQYEEQGRFYVETLQAALGLADEPRFELWFLRVGEVVSA